PSRLHLPSLLPPGRRCSQGPSTRRRRPRSWSPSPCGAIAPAAFAEPTGKRSLLLATGKVQQPPTPGHPYATTALASECQQLDATQAGQRNRLLYVAGLRLRAGRAGSPGDAGQRPPGAPAAPARPTRAPPGARAHPRGAPPTPTPRRPRAAGRARPGGRPERRVPTARRSSVNDDPRARVGGRTRRAVGRLDPPPSSPPPRREQPHHPG